MRFGRTLVMFIGLTAILLSGELWLKNGLAFNTNRIVFTFYAEPHNNDIYVMDTDGGNRENLTNHPATDVDPDWSPDKTKIAFSSNRNGGARQIYVMDADGKNPIRLTDGQRNAQGPDWSPDGGRIAFWVDDWDDHIDVMDADGKNRVMLVNDAAQPSWSPDGREIAFSSTRDGKGAWSDIYVIGADGQGLRTLTDEFWSGFSPAFSPDGKRIAFVSMDGSFYHIFLVGADGKNRVRLTNKSEHHGDPAWSVSGRRMAYTVSDNDGPSTIHLMTSDGEYVKRLSVVEGANDFQPDIRSFGLAVSPTSKTAAIWGRVKKLSPDLR